ncbi:3-phosphoserine/phosphohydroxythreonine transaminase [Hyphomicrobium sp. LHD-15]|uniref:3-phosphoserine/phosphohydroxythreonine transaminase n=1 Tax=Hyphomicrobium sp. LHD-15 TaxID=3072142 RepID=UPI0028102BDD|nr:3-phosphoserine/phosphohydroxythreonine transaminase [Hyphomicrobium sp. LHD-15]MDQ8698262.1 3-phosphoserine/phosphohydroxythreonine transaminase [Hyphomicrobium sp. LHD-15]
MKVVSFSSAASKLPDDVLAALRDDIGEWRSSGVSALELPFTGKEFADIAASAEHDLRALLDLPESYRVLFLQGGASAQFSLLPMNLLGDKNNCDYVQSGYWSRRAFEAASPYCNPRVIALGSESALPEPSTWDRSPNAAYCHYTTNETVDGLQFQSYPEDVAAPLVADMTADFLTRPIPVERFGLIYASAQKNLGAAGLTIVIVRQELLDRARSGTPAPFDYARQDKSNSRVNTPPTFAVLVAGRMLAWLREHGGLAAAAARNKVKSAKLYAAIDESGGFYSCRASPRHRSSISICFRLPDPALDLTFAEEAQATGLCHLRGHPEVGGLRASLYNAVAEDAVDALVSFMSDFKRRRG